MAPTGIIKPGTVLVRDRVQVHNAARDGEICSPRVARMVNFILSMLTDTERTAVTSRGRPQSYSPPVHRFVRAADTFIARFELQELLQNHQEHNADMPPQASTSIAEAGGQAENSIPAEEEGSQTAQEVLAPIRPTAHGSGLPRTSQTAHVEQEVPAPVRPTAHGSGAPQTPQGTNPQKRKVSPSFQSERKRSLPPADKITFVHTDGSQLPVNTETTSVQTDEPDSPVNWQGIGSKFDSDSPETIPVDSFTVTHKGKEKEPGVVESDRWREGAELQRERGIRAAHRVTLSERISAAAPISALQRELDNPISSTSPYQHRPVPPSPSCSTCSPSPLTNRDRRFSVNELGSPSFNNVNTSTPWIPRWKREKQSSDIELTDAPAQLEGKEQSPVDVKIEDAPPPPTPRAQLIPGSCSPQTHLRFGDFEVPIPAGRWIAVDREIQLPDALAEDQHTAIKQLSTSTAAQPRVPAGRWIPVDREIQLPDASAEDQRTAETQLFTSTAAQPRVSLPPTPVQQIPSVKQSFTPTYLPPTSYGSLFAPASFKSARHDKSMQTGPDMTAKKMEALEEMMKQLMVANEKRDTAMDILLARNAPQAFQHADEEQERKRAIFEQLEEERLQKLLAIEAELKEKYEAAGFQYNPTSPSGREEQLRTTEEQQQEHRAEHVKMSQIGPSGKKIAWPRSPGVVCVGRAWAA
jgi:hypothetical protein